jgi:cytochrome c553
MTLKGGNDDPPMAVAVPITNSVSTSYAVPSIPPPAFNGTSYAVPSAPPPAFNPAVASAPAVIGTITTTSYTIPPPSASAPAHAPAIMYGSLGRRSVAVQCPFCHGQTVTRTRDQMNGVTIIATIGLLFLFWPLFWIPLCMPSFKTTNHFCTRCHQKISETDPCS